jgi:hypothetical protein
MRYYEFHWARLMYKVPFNITELRKRAEDIANVSNMALAYRTNTDLARNHALEVRPIVNRFVADLLRMIETQIDLSEKRDMVFYWMIRDDLKSVFQTLNEIEKDIGKSDYVNYSTVQIYLNKIETLVGLIYDSIVQAAENEPKDKKRFLGALWMNIRSGSSILRERGEREGNETRPINYADMFNEKNKDATDTLYNSLKETDKTLKGFEREEEDNEGEQDGESI